MSLGEDRDGKLARALHALDETGFAGGTGSAATEDELLMQAIAAMDEQEAGELRAEHAMEQVRQ